MKRNIDLKLIRWMNNPIRLPLIVKGARQIGKTFSIKSFAKKHFKTYHYLNFEENPLISQIFDGPLTPSVLLEGLSFHLEKVINVEEDLIIFDEIQACPRALTSLKYFAEREGKALYLLVAGSLLGIHLTDLSFPVGKVEFLDMYPLNFSEFIYGIEDKKGIMALEAFTDDKAKTFIPIMHEYLFDIFKYYLLVGGLPRSVLTFKEHRDQLFHAFSEVRNIQHSLITAYLADMAKHSGKTPAINIERVWSNVPSQLGLVVDSNTERYKFSGVIPGNSSYAKLAGPIDWLCKARLILKIEIANQGLLPLRGFTKDNIFKLFYFDVGMLSAVLRLDPKAVLNYNFGTYKGFLAENFVATELLAAGEKGLISWNEGTAEMEFVLEKNGYPIPVEVKSGNVTQAKSLKVFLNKYKCEKAYILSAKLDLSNNVDKQVQRVPIYMAEKIVMNPLTLV